jgi:hypothetical protein
MNQLIITEKSFPPSRIKKLVTSEKTRIFCLNGAKLTFGTEITVVLNPDETWQLWEQAYKLAQDWYLANEKDVTIYNGISLGCILEIEMWYFWRDTLEKIEIFSRLLCSESYEVIYLATFENDRLQKIFSQLVGESTAILTISPSISSRLRLWSDREFVKQRLKDLELDRHVRFLVLTWDKLRHFRRSRHKNTLDVLALLEQPGSYLADSLLPVLTRFASSGIVLSHPQQSTKIHQTDREVIYILDYMISRLPDLIHSIRVLSKRWDSLEKLLENSFDHQYNGVVLWPVVKDRIERLVKRKIPLTMVEIEAVTDCLKERQVKVILLVSDAHHGGRLFTLIGNKLGIKSIVLQHGATMGKWGYIPLYATRFAAWGDLSKEWMIQRGVPPEKVIITGAPRLDSIVTKNSMSSREALCLQYSIPVSGFILMWAIDPIPKTENSAIFEKLHDAVSRLPWLYLIVRPHPGIEQLHWVFNMVEGNERVILSSSLEDLHSSINAVDVILIQGSTVGIEAMILDKPVVVFQDSTSSLETFYTQTGAAAKANNSEELCQVLNELYQARISNHADGFSEARKNFVYSYVNAVDGRSTQRVVAIMQEMLSE